MKRSPNDHLNLRDIVEAELSELAKRFAHLHFQSLQEWANEDFILRNPILSYGRVLLAFMRGEQTLIQHFENQLARVSRIEPKLTIIHTAVELRLRLLQGAYSSFLLEKAQNLVNKDPEWEGELAILMAAVYGSQNDRIQAMNWYQRAEKGFDRIGAPRKAVRCRLNVLVEKTRLDPSRNWLEEYFDIYHQAMKRGVREKMAAGLCLLNISRDYQCLGAGMVALRYCDRAIKLLENEYGTLPYYLGLIHRCNLNLEMKRILEAKIDYELASPARFAEVRSALLLLESAFKPEKLKDSRPFPRLTATWEERRVQWLKQGIEVPNKLSPKEEELVLFLGKGKKCRPEIIEFLYGDRLDYETRTNRFKSLLGKLRKKAPDLIIQENGTYRLALQLFVPDIQSA